MNAFLCTPCAAMVVPEVQAVKLDGKRKKEICACCRRKRFTDVYAVNYFKFRRAVKKFGRPAHGGADG